MKIHIDIAKHIHLNYTEEISKAIKEAINDGDEIGLAERDADYFASKINEGKAVIALVEDEFAGFGYIEYWDNKNYVGNAGLIVIPKYRRLGIARKIKRKLFELSLCKFPDAKIFEITTSLAVMKIDSELGYSPVTFSELTKDSKYWDGCRTCKFYDILQKNNRANCLCTAMLYDTKAKSVNTKIKKTIEQYKRIKNIKNDKKKN